jgi:endonuclease III
MEDIQNIAVKQLFALKKAIPVPLESKRLAAEGWDENWQCLLAIILSAQNRDAQTIEVCKNLFEIYKTCEELSKSSIEKIENEIHSINYYKAKSGYIKKTCQLIFENNNQIPHTIDELIKFPGVGRKTANVYLAHVHKKQAIGVDTHVARISIKLGWTNAKFEQREKIEKDLQNLFPKKYWREINSIVVRFGQTIGQIRRLEDEKLEKIKKINF